jgi:hypothetical protein
MNTYLELEDKNAMTHDQRMKNGVGCKFLPTNYDGVCLHLRLILEDPIFYFCQIDTIEYFSLKCLTNSIFGD